MSSNEIKPARGKQYSFKFGDEDGLSARRIRNLYGEIKIKPTCFKPIFVLPYKGRVETMSTVQLEEEQRTASINTVNVINEKKIKDKKEKESYKWREIIAKWNMPVFQPNRVRLNLSLYIRCIFVTQSSIFSVNNVILLIIIKY